MKVCIIWDYDKDLGPDPNDPYKAPRRLAEILDSDKQDVMVAWSDKRGQTHFVTTGVFDTKAGRAALP